MNAALGGEREGGAMVDLIALALADVATGVEQLSAGWWRATLAGDVDLAVTVRIDDWLLFDAPLSPQLSLPHRALHDPRNMAAADAVWELLAFNAAMAGAPKFVVAPSEGHLHLRAELPLDVETPVRERVLQTCDELGTAVRRLRGSAVHSSAHGGAGAPARDMRERLPRLCEEAGWSFVQRPDGCLAVDLGVRDLLCQAVVEPGSCGQVRASVEVVIGDSARPPICRQAVGLLLLRASGAIRMMRAAAEAIRGGNAARFEVAFAWEPSAAELAHALSALSVGCRLHAREAALLQSDEVLAEAYLGVVAREA